MHNVDLNRYAKELVDKVAALESQLMSARTPQATSSPQRPEQEVQADGISRGTGNTSIRAVLTDTSLCNTDLDGLMKYSRPLECTIPPEADCRILTDAYFEHSNFFTPFLNQHNFVPQVQKLYGKNTNAITSDTEAVFMLCAVLAISARLLHCTDPTYSIASAERYFAVALAAYEGEDGALRTGNLDELECLLLVVQYTMFASDLTTCFRYLQLAINLAVSLKLHVFPSDINTSTLRGNASQSHVDDHLVRGQWPAAVQE